MAETVRRLNARCAGAWEIERACLKPLPLRRTADFEEVDARVSKFSVFSAKSVLYSVPSRLAGHQLKVRLHSTKLRIVDAGQRWTAPSHRSPSLAPALQSTAHMA